MNARLRDIDALPGAARRLVELRSPEDSRKTVDAIACEMPVALHYNGESFVVLMATPCHLTDLALGFSLSENIVVIAGELGIDGVDETVEGIAIRMSVPQARADALANRSRNLPGHGGCGVCGSTGIESILRAPPRIDSRLQVTEDALHRALDALHALQPLNAATGATHAAGFANAAGELLLVREDVGRHNALDKVIGAMASQHIAADSGFAIVTSRASFELAMKSAQVGIPLLAAISAPTTLAIAVAESAGMCLAGFTRKGRCSVYAHAQRLLATP